MTQEGSAGTEAYYQDALRRIRVLERDFALSIKHEEELVRENAKLSKALFRQADNMAFILNHVDIPGPWLEKFQRELQQDRDGIGRDGGETRFG